MAKKVKTNTVVEDYGRAQRTIDNLGTKIELKRVLGKKVELDASECEDVQGLIRMFCLLRSRSFDQWLKER